MRTARAPRGRFAPRPRPIVYAAPPVGGALIDEQLPRYDVRQAYQVVVIAPTEAVYDAVARRAFLTGELTKFGAFEPVGERARREIVFGAIGRPWDTQCGPVRMATSDFAGFAKPGFAKIAWSWIVKPLGAGQSLLVVEWRVRLTDESVRAEFRRYWSETSKELRRLARAAIARIETECEAQCTRTS